MFSSTLPPTSDQVELRVSPCSDSSGTITFDEFKNVFKAQIKPDAIPFDFDWCESYMPLPHVFLTTFLPPLIATGLNSTWEPRTAPMF